LNLLGMEVADRLATGRSVLPSLLKEPQTAMFAVNPADQMAQAVTKAEVSPLGFYSAVEQQALKIPRKQGTGDSFLNDLMKGQDVKKYEIEAMGLDTYLKGKPNVTRQEVQDFIANNKLDVQEVIRSDALPPAEPYYLDTQRLNTLESEFKQLKQHPIDDPTFGQEKFDELMKLQNIRDESTVESLYNSAESSTRQAQRAQAQGRKDIAEKYFREAEMFNTRAEAFDLRGLGIQAQEPIAPTKFGQYQLPGGENYRELLLTLPNKPMDAGMAAENYYTQFVKRGGEPEWAQLNPAKQQEITNAMPTQARNASAAPEYRSSHFNEPNILAHMRVNDRVDAEGKKMLLIEEVQSDWHQAGREKGYKGKGTLTELPDNYFVQELKTIDGDTMYVVRDNSNPSVIINKDYNRQSAINGVINELNATSAGGVPDAPFKDTWHQLALKRAIKEAVDKGYDRIGLTTGAQQAERYDLSKQVDELNYKRNDDGTYQLSAQANGRGNMLGETVPKEKLSDYVGKEVAEKITKNEGFDRNFGGTGSVSQPKDIWKGLSGLDLKIGGEGMKKYYDEVYPNYLNKLSKKYGAQVGETKINTGIDNLPAGSSVPTMKQEPVRYLDITPEMRKAIKEGQPLASIEEELAKALA